MVRVVEGYSAALTQQVLAGELEFAVVPAFSGAPGLKSRLFLRTPELLVSSRRLKRTHWRPYARRASARSSWWCRARPTRAAA